MALKRRLLVIVLSVFLVLWFVFLFLMQRTMIKEDISGPQNRVSVVQDPRVSEQSVPAVAEKGSLLQVGTELPQRNLLTNQPRPWNRLGDGTDYNGAARWRMHGILGVGPDGLPAWKVKNPPPEKVCLPFIVSCVPDFVFVSEHRCFTFNRST